jgi:hypothetical protein
MDGDAGKVRKITTSKAPARERDRQAVDPAGRVHRWRIVAFELEADCEPEVEVEFNVSATFRPAE